jgi:hypothetical protein
MATTDLHRPTLCELSVQPAHAGGHQESAGKHCMSYDEGNAG